MEDKICPACKNVNASNNNLCEKCEFPFTGTEKEKSTHIGKFILKRGIIVDSEDSLTKSQNLLYLAAGLYTLGVIISFSTLSNFVLGFNILIIAVIITCGVLLNKAPLLFLIVPLVMLMMIYILSYIADPNSLFRGILFKLLIIASLSYSIFNYIASNKFKKKYNYK